MLMQSHGATVILSRPLRIPFVLEIARRCRSFSYSFLRDGLPVIDIGVDSEPAHDVALFNCYIDESDTIRNLRLCPFGSLANNPLTYIGGAGKQYNTLVLGVAQESYNLNSHKCDFTQVHVDTYVLIVHLSPYVADVDRLNSANEPQDSCLSAHFLFNSQIWSI